jgi:hypothetical protein
MASRVFVTGSLVAVIVVLTGGIPGVAAPTVTLDFGSLPSAQGWDYWAFNNTYPESSAYSVSGGILHQDTIGAGFEGTGNNIYVFPISVAPDLPFALRLRARVTAVEVPYPGQEHPFGFSFAVEGDSAGVGVGVGTFIQNPAGQAVHGIDTTQYHDYLLQGTLTGGYSLFVDGNLAMTGAPYSLDYTTGSNELSLGDGTGAENARADVSYFSFTQPTPEPSTLTLLGAGAVGLSAYGWRRRR